MAKNLKVRYPLSTHILRENQTGLSSDQSQRKNYLSVLYLNGIEKGLQFECYNLSESEFIL